MLFHFEAASSSTKWLPRIQEEARKAKIEGIFGLHLTVYMARTDAKHQQFFNLIIHENIDEIYQARLIPGMKLTPNRSRLGVLSLSLSRSLSLRLCSSLMRALSHTHTH